MAGAHTTKFAFAGLFREQADGDQVVHTINDARVVAVNDFEQPLAHHSLQHESVEVSANVCAYVCVMCDKLCMHEARDVLGVGNGSRICVWSHNNLPHTQLEVRL